MKKLLLIVNPMAGKSMYKEGLGEALAILARGGYETTPRSSGYGIDTADALIAGWRKLALK